MYSNMYQTDGFFNTIYQVNYWNIIFQLNRAILLSPEDYIIVLAYLKAF